MMDIEIRDVLNEVYELSCRIGMLCCLNNKPSLINDVSRDMQSTLWHVCNYMNDEDYHEPSCLRLLLESRIEDLVCDIKEMERDNIVDHSKFILPGSNTVNAQLYLCGSQTRKLQRTFHHYQKMMDELLVSDMDKLILKFFEHLERFYEEKARWYCAVNNIPEIAVNMYDA
jgi:cob(I)alamin adenosyltransferase